MTCFKPVQGFRSAELNVNGKRSIVFKESDSLNGEVLNLPCGQCIGCRLEYSRSWAVRCVHEASLYEDNCFITLTYANEHLPPNSSLEYEHWTQFMKNLRERLFNKTYASYRDQGLSVKEARLMAREKCPKIRFFMGPEYGELTHRPHYHALIFNYYPDDCELLQIRNGNRLYKSQFLTDIWDKGFVSVGSVTFESAAYVARYMLKKVKGNDSDGRYLSKFFDPVTGETFALAPEKARMSRMPGLGKAWFDKFNSDVYPSDFVVHDGRKMRPPRYYDSLIKNLDPFLFDDIQAIRVDNFSDPKLLANSTRERLDVRCLKKELDIKALVRNLPDDCY